MSQMSRYYLLDFNLSEGDEHEVQRELEAEFLREGMTVDAYPGLGRMVLITSEAYAPERVEQCLDDMGHKITTQWLSGPHNGKTLTVNLQYRDNGQVVSATVDEGLLICALAGKHDEEAALKAAVTALAGENEFEIGYSPMDGTLLVQDIMTSVEFWNGTKAAKWSPMGWDPEEPMLEISFKPEADTEDRSAVIPVHVEGMLLEWKMPLRLLPEGVDHRDHSSLDQLATLPCAPEKVRLWAAMMPFTLAIDNPNIIPAPDNGPGL